jgi:large conductance mechanosensitive channel
MRRIFFSKHNRRCTSSPWGSAETLFPAQNRLEPATTDQRQGATDATSNTKDHETMFQEFKSFIARGNVMDMAVGIIIGAAFTAIVSSLVSDLINPIIGVFTGEMDFTDKYLVLSGSVPDGASLDAAREAGAAIFAYGAFAMAVVNFLIIAVVAFLLVKMVNRVKAASQSEPAPEQETGPSQLDVLLDIRDALRK